LINFSVTFCDGDQFDLNFVNNGNWSNECGILLTDPNGAIVYQRNPGTNINSGNLFTGTATCAPVLNCTDPSALGVQNITLNSADLNFTSNSGVSRIQFGPSGFPLGSGVFVAVVTASPFTASGLQPNTSYDFYVQDSCGVGVTSNWVGPFTFTTTSCPSVTASFTYTVNGTTINVDGTASSGSFFQWDFNGQGSSFDSVATYTFGAEGVYDISLINSNACGSTDTLTISLDFCAPLAATITENINLLNAGFVALPSSGVPTQYIWDFGDGNSGSGQSINHTYATEGIYNVVLTMTNACGDTASSNLQVQLCDSIIGDIAFTFSGTTFSFDGSGSSSNAVDFQWYFGDGSTDTVVSPTYSYTNSGTYTVSLVVTNACGESDSITTNVTVCAKPTARWTFSVIQSSPFGMDVQFDASASTGAVSYFWNFGDGTTNNTSGFPTHTYGTPGFFYVVTLIVYNSCGDSDTLRSSLASIGVDEPEWDEQLLLYPNPTRDFVEITWDGLPNGEEQVQYTVVDAQGRVMAEYTERIQNGQWKTTLDMRSWASGVYFIRLQSGNRQALRRIIKD
jgi:PKD repeat protein